MDGRPAVEGQGKAVFLMDYDGAQQRRVTPNKSINVGAAWGPDGKTLAYSSYMSSRPDIYMTLLDASSPRHRGDPQLEPRVFS